MITPQHCQAAGNRGFIFDRKSFAAFLHKELFGGFGSTTFAACGKADPLAAKGLQGAL
jgi:hypothetical protein